MRWVKLAFQAIRWADHLDEAGWYRNKRYFVQLLGLLATAVAFFGFDLPLEPEEKAAVAGGIVALIDVFTRMAGRKIDAAEETLPDEAKPKRARKAGPRK